MKLIKILLISVFMLGAQGNIYAMMMSLTQEGFKFQTWPQFTAKTLIYGPNGMVFPGWVQNGGKFAAVARITSAGTPDASFGNNGLAILNTAPNQEAISISFNPSGTMFVHLRGADSESKQIEITANGKLIPTTAPSLREFSVSAVAKQVKSNQITLEQAKKVLPTDLHDELEEAIKAIKD